MSGGPGDVVRGGARGVAPVSAGSAGYGVVIVWRPGDGPYLTATCSCGWTRVGLRTEAIAADWDEHVFRAPLDHHPGQAAVWAQEPPEGGGEGITPG